MKIYLIILSFIIALTFSRRTMKRQDINSDIKQIKNNNLRLIKDTEEGIAKNEKVLETIKDIRDSIKSFEGDQTERLKKLSRSEKNVEEALKLQREALSQLKH